MVEAILFDVDGTLMDNNLLHVLAWQRAFRRLGTVVEANPIVHLVGMGGDQLAPRVLEGEPPEVAERARELYKEEYSETVRKGSSSTASRYQVRSTCSGPSVGEGLAWPSRPPGRSGTSSDMWSSSVARGCSTSW